MAEQTNPNYQSISDPYDSYIVRADTIFGAAALPNGNALSDPSSTDNSTSSITGGATADGSPVSTEPFDNGDNSIDGKALDNLTIASWIKSRNYKPGKSGFYLDGATGNVEFGSGKFRGDITGSSGTFSGTLSAATLLYGKTSFIDSTNAGYYINSAGLYFGSASDAGFLKYTVGTGTLEIKNFKITSLAANSSIDGQYLGALTVATGALANLAVTAGKIDNATITATQIASATITAAQIANATITTNQISGTAAITGGQIGSGTITTTNISGTAGITGGQIALATIAGGNISATTITAGNITSLTITAAQIANLTITSNKVNTALMSYSHNIVFSVASDVQVNWASGTLTTSDGTAYSIVAGNTGTMSAKNYIYLDIAVSVTILQKTTTFSTAVGDGKMLVAVCQNNTTEAVFQVFNGIGGMNLAGGSIVAHSITANEIAAATITASQIAAGTITATQIAALTITASEIAAATITSGKMNVTDLSAISANIGAITAGSIGVINGVNTVGFTPAGTNAIFSGPTGAPTFYVTPAGVLTAIGATITGTLQTATSGQRMIITSSDNTLRFYDSVGQVVGMGSTAGSAIRLDLNSTTNNGVTGFSSVVGNGFYYSNSGNVSSKGFFTELTGATNSGTGVEVNHDGSGGSGVFLDCSAGAVGLRIDQSGAGNSITLSHSNDTSKAIEIFYTGRSNAVYIESTDSANELPALFVKGITASTGLSNFAAEFNRDNNGTVVGITQTLNTSINTCGLVINMANAGSGLEHAIAFEGGTFVSAAVTGTQDRKIRVLVNGATYFIPCYNA